MAAFIRNLLLRRLQIWSLDGCSHPRTSGWGEGGGWVSVSGRCEQERGSGALGGSECEPGRGQNSLILCPASLIDASLP